MRRFILLATLPVFAAAPVSMKITHAAVTWGAGEEPKREMPPGHFEAQVLIRGRNQPVRPFFRVWRVKISDFPGLENRKAKIPPLDKTPCLQSVAVEGVDDIWVLQGTWIGAPELDDRLVVEVRTGSSRLGWASSRLTEHLIQTIGKPPGTARDD